MRRKIIWFVIFVFIAVNILLVFIDDSGKVTRHGYVSEWDNVYTTDLFETVDAKGVVAYADENYVFFDKSIGSFDGFLVEEGTEIAEGDPLFEYRVHDYATMEAALQNQLIQVKGEISAIEDAIAEMVAYTIPSPTVPVVNTDEEEDINVVVPSSDPIEAELQKKQFLIEKEQELVAKREQGKNIESQLDDLRAGGDTITVNSPYQGKVKSISSTLADPLIVIETTEIQVAGELTEDARISVEPGQSVEVTLVESEQELKGSVQGIGDSPVGDVAVNEQSVYPVDVAFADDSQLDAVLPGYHANLTITVNEALNAATIQEKYLFHNHIWRLSKDGKLEKVPIETGIFMGNQVEVMNGVVAGDTIATESMQSSFMDMPFITPLKFETVPWLKLGDYKDWKHYLVMGLLAR
ncbi:efflux RND transporter periplasmic adaptor subunit [Ornithinibacillus xuwenensis]|uniref:Efflux RND transporter periplasmic adaptor subunit n=1 Tax=Ornithinibacillus xuwenensis TaxID=3144668 RepID=A0ABU9XLC1_9BACI